MLNALPRLQDGVAPSVVQASPKNEDPGNPARFSDPPVIPDMLAEGHEFHGDREQPAGLEYQR